MNNTADGGEIYHQYVKYTRKYRSIYGANTIVLMQVGAFFEVYSNGEDDIDIQEVSLELDMKIGIKQSNIKMTGFHCDGPNKEKHIKRLLDCGYTLVIVEQVGDGVKHKERDVTEILSPSINTIGIGNNSNYLITIVANAGELGITIIDISTGRSFLFQETNNRDDPERALDQLCRISITFNPIEALIIDPEEHFGEDIMKVMRSTKCCSVYHYNNWDKMEFMDNLSDPIYQRELFLKIFKKTNVASTIGILEGSTISTSLCCSLQFIKDHNPRAICFLDLPVIQHNASRYLSIQTDGAVQLNYISMDKRENSVVKIINRCSTAFGKRTMYDRMLNPLADQSEIENRYNVVDMYIQDHLWKRTLENLKNITDIEKINRRIIMEKVSSSDWLSLISCLDDIKMLYGVLEREKEIEIILEIQNTLSGFSQENLAKVSNIKDSTIPLFDTGYSQTLDTYVNDRKRSLQELEGIADKITSIGRTADATLCRMEKNGDDHIITMTKKRYEKALELDRDNGYLNNNFTMKPSKKQGNVLLTSNIITEHSKQILAMEEKIKDINIELYNNFIASFVENHIHALINIIKDVAEIDINTCMARNAVEWDLTKPVISGNTTDGSSVSIKGLRHPIIERSSACVENNVSLSSNGMLLYGINSSGKSSLMKAVGINILLAQAGSFVFAKEMCYQPYQHLMTRITGKDNIFRGLSTFEVEINELRNIVLRANKHSLVLGDEVCSGTESVSAISIVCATLKRLVDQGSSFIFATHLHELVNMTIIKELIPKHIYVAHIEIKFENNKIIYNRTLKEGPGDPVYGIDVCRCLRMPMDFLKIACDVKKELMDEDMMIVSTRRSNYNSMVMMDKCAICGKRADDTHHLRYQCDYSDDNKSKNFKGNLIPLCKDCHIAEHNNKITIEGAIETNEGLEVCVINQTDKTDTNQLEYDIEKLEPMRDYLRLGKRDKWWIRKRKNGIFIEETSLDTIIQNIFKKTKVLLTIDDLQDDMIKRVFTDFDL